MPTATRARDTLRAWSCRRCDAHTTAQLMDRLRKANLADLSTRRRLIDRHSTAVDLHTALIRLSFAKTGVVSALTRPVS